MQNSESPLISRTPLRIGLIGAGAISQHFYLPALLDHEAAIVSAVVEPDRMARDKVSSLCLPDYLGANLDQSLGSFDAAIVAIPNNLHFEVCHTLLKAGKHVLCEKPLTVNNEENLQLIELASAQSLLLTVAHVRRYYPATRLIKQIIDDGRYGPLRGFEIEEGTVFNWPTLTGYLFDREKSGGGVLIDIGYHLLDLLLWWIPSDVTCLKYQDDNLGGVEAYVRMELEFASGVGGSMKISRLSILKNICKLSFEKADIEWDPMTTGKIYLKEPSENRRALLKNKLWSPAKDLLSDYFSAVMNASEPPVSGSEALQVIRLIELCYEKRENLSLNWLTESRKESAQR